MASSINATKPTATGIPRLTVAQVLADLSTLNLAEPAAATNLITAHSPLPTSTVPRRVSRAPLSIPDAPWVAKEKMKTVATPAGTPSSESHPTHSTSEIVADGAGIVAPDIDMTRACDLLRLYDMRQQLEEGGEMGKENRAVKDLGNLAGGGGIRGLEMARRGVAEVDRRFSQRRSEMMGTGDGGGPSQDGSRMPIEASVTR